MIEALHLVSQSLGRGDSPPLPMATVSKIEACTKFRAVWKFVTGELDYALHQFLLLRLILCTYLV